MNCDEYRSAVHAYACQELSAQRAAQVELHMRECLNCVEFNAICAELLCRDFVGFIGEYIDGGLEEKQREVFGRHMTVCPDCTAYLDSYRRTVELGATAGQEADETSGKIPEELIRAILDARDQQPDGPARD